MNKYEKQAIETLLTAYEKEKEANRKLDKEAQGYLEELAGDGSMNTRRIQELEAELEKEKEKNKVIIKELEKHIKFCEQEAEGSLNNEICHISLKFNKKLLNILNEEE